MKRKTVWLGALTAVLAAPVVLTIAVFVSLREPRLALGPVVHVQGGAIRGGIIDDIVVYRGIPFAAPPIGELRWRAPQPVKPWSGILAATSFQPACMQTGAPIPGGKRGPMSEDCLYLNVWAPGTPPRERLPVMVFLHGGGGISGSASPRVYWGDGLVRRGVVTVNVSYRLGTLGWLAHPELTEETTYKASGNYALLDMVAALRWVRDNIAAFGGDPNNVTLFGHSAGAYSASKLMVSPLAKDLFHKVIGQSGGDLYPAGTNAGIAYLADAERAGVDFASGLGAASLAELRRLPANEILEAPLPQPWMRLPVVDGYALIDDTADLYARGKQLRIPIIVGYNAAEGTNLVGQPVANAHEFRAQMEQEYGDFASRFLELYPARSQAEAVQSQMRLAGERTANWAVVRWADLHAASGSDVYVYHFAQRPPFGPLRKLGAAHGAELPYVFGSTPRWMRMFTQWPWKAARDLAIAEQVPEYWTNFAKTGTPNAPGLPHWRAYNRNREVLHFAADETRLGPMPDEDEHALMDEYVDSLAARTTHARRRRR